MQVIRKFIHKFIEVSHFKIGDKVIGSSSAVLGSHSGSQDELRKNQT